MSVDDPGDDVDKVGQRFDVEELAGFNQRGAIGLIDRSTGLLSVTDDRPALILPKIAALIGPNPCHDASILIIPQV